MIKCDYLSESVLKEIFQITIQIREFEFATKTVDNLFKFSAQESNLSPFVRNGTNVKIPSELNVRFMSYSMLDEALKWS